MKVYLAGGFFTDVQNNIMAELENAMSMHGVNTFSPRRDNLGTLGCDWDAIYKRNIEELHTCDMVFASTQDKDMGTIFECGYATAIGKPIAYYAPNLSGLFNLMLAKTSIGVCTSREQLIEYVAMGMPNMEYVHEME